MTGEAIQKSPLNVSEELRRKWLIVERIVVTPSGKSRPALSEDEVKQHLLAAAEYLVRSGVLDNIVELLASIVMLHDVITDRMVDDIAKNIIRPLGLLIDSLSRTSLLELVSRAVMDPDVEKAFLEVKEGRKISTMTLLSLLNDAEVRQGIYIVLKLLKAIGKAAKELD